MQIFQPLLLLIYNFPVLCIDTNIGPIHDQIKLCHNHNSHYDHFVNFGHYSLEHYGLEYG